MRSRLKYWLIVTIALIAMIYALVFTPNNTLTTSVSEWQHYSNKDLHIAFDYPTDWRVTVEQDSHYVAPGLKQQLLDSGMKPIDIERSYGKLAFTIALYSPFVRDLGESYISLFSQEYVMHPPSDTSDVGGDNVHMEQLFDKFKPNIQAEASNGYSNRLKVTIEESGTESRGDEYVKSLTAIRVDHQNIVGIHRESRFCYQWNSPERDNRWKACKGEVERILDSVEFLQ